MFFSFGINASAAIISRDWLWPLPGINRLSSCFGDNRNHNAIDIVAPKGTSIVASMSGKVVKTYTSCPYNYAKSSNCPCGSCLNLGNAVYIEHTYGGKSYVSRYGHMTNVNVSVGQKVNAGDVIGTVGCTGRSTGYHLDFQIYEGTLSAKVKYIDPLRSPFVMPIEGLNANAASTSCCYQYVREVYEILNKETHYKDICKVTKCENTSGTVQASCEVWSQPCSSSEYPYVIQLTALTKNDKVKVLEIIENTVGEYWYYIGTSTGATGYVRAEKVFALAFYSGFAYYTATSAVTAYKYPDRSSGAAATYAVGSQIIIKGSAKTPNSGFWYVTKDDTYISAGDVDKVTYSSSLRMNGTPYPYNTLEAGKSYTLSGTVSSDNLITGIKAEVKNTAGNTVLSNSVTCSTNSYSFKGSAIDTGLKFSSLDSGSYTYILTVTETVADAFGKTQNFTTVFKNTFSVGGSFNTTAVNVTDNSGTVSSFTPGASFSALTNYDVVTISGHEYPGKIELGKSFSVCGTVRSTDTPIKSVTVRILNSAGAAVISETVSPNSLTYNIGKIDSRVKFNTLAAGSYIYEIKAVNGSGSFKLVSAPFTVFDSNAENASSAGLGNFVSTRPYYGQFADVKLNDWFYQNVKTSYELRIISGMSDKTFCPNDNLTIAECITIAARLHSIYYTGKADFVQTGKWYKVYVNYALANGIISNSYSDYNAPATRAVVAEMFYNVLPNEALAAINKISDGSIPDVPASGGYADAVYKLYRAGVLNGTGDNRAYNPDDCIRRSEVSAIISRMAVPSMRKHFSM